MANVITRRQAAWARETVAPI